MNSTVTTTTFRGMDRRALIIALPLVAGAFIARTRIPDTVTQPISNREFRKLIPIRVGNWTSRRSSELVLPQEDETAAKLYENLETFVYEFAQLPTVMMLVAYNSVQQNDVHAHRPEVCYPASGYPIISSANMTLVYKGKNIPCRYLVAQRGGFFEHVIYWVRIGETFPVDWVSQRIDMALSNFSGTVPDGTLFRVSMLAETSAADSDMLSAFIRSFLETSNETLTKLLLKPR